MKKERLYGGNFQFKPYYHGHKIGNHFGKLDILDLNFSPCKIKEIIHISEDWCKVAG